MLSCLAALKSAQKDHSDGVCELYTKQLPITTLYATFKWAIILTTRDVICNYCM
jgi:hypothetical protein